MNRIRSSGCVSSESKSSGLLKSLRAWRGKGGPERWRVLGALGSTALLALFCGACLSRQLGPVAAKPVAALAPLSSTTAKPSPTPALYWPQALPIDERKGVRLRADQMRYNDARKQTTFQGHVQAKQDTTRLWADELSTSTKGESALVRGNVRLLDTARQVELWAAEGEYAGGLTEAWLRGGVVLHSHDTYAVPVTISGATVWYQATSRQARLEGGVRVERGRLTATARRVDLDGLEEKIFLSGGVEAVLLGNAVRSERAELDGRARSARFEGRVEARIVPEQLRQAAEHPERP